MDLNFPYNAAASSSILSRNSSNKRSDPGYEDKGPARKKAKTAKSELAGGDAGGRKVFLNKLRAICNRVAVHCQPAGGGLRDGKELLRLFIRDAMGPSSKRWTPRDLECRHAGMRPDGVEMCQTAGTRDMGKANAFLIRTLKSDLRKWLKAKKTDPNFDWSESESEEDDEGGDEFDDDVVELRVPTSSFNADDYPSSQPEKSQISTKQRLTLLTYLLAHSESRADFSQALRDLGDKTLCLVHLCGCGISSTELPNGACVTGSHLKLASAEVNRIHTHYHEVIRRKSTKVQYIALLKSIQGEPDGQFDDVF